MALAFVAQSAVSAVIEKLISTPVSYVWERIAGRSSIQDEIQRLQQALPRIEAILGIVEQGQTVTTKQNDVLDDWLWQLRDAVDQAEDVLDEMDYYELEKAVQAGDNKVQQDTALNLKRKYADFTTNIFGNDDTLKRLREAVKALDNVAATSETLLQLVSQLYNSDVKRRHEDEIRNARETSSFLTEDTICGRDTEKERIVEWLTKPTSDEPENASAAVGNVSAFTIVGMGGLGKTTLAQFIYHDEKVQEFFDLVMWVCVSDQFDVTMLTRKILEAAKVRDSLGDKCCLNTIQDILKENLISKKFLLVLDDVWNDDKILEWNKLVAPLKFGKKGSKILLTTRMNSVAKTVAKVLQDKKESLELSGLKEDDFIPLFNKHAFAGENIDDHKNLQLIGQQIAKKLRGYPLAAKILGGYLNSCMDERHWRKILNKNFLNLQESKDNIMMILRLSYDHLPTSLQICFRYCSIFPKDHEFKKNKLIRMWIGSGLIKKSIHERQSLEDTGEEYLNHLARKSLFDIKISKYGSNRKQQYYVMHDLLHDLAQRVSSGECLGVEGDGSRQIPKTIRHLYLKRVNPHMISNLKNLRTLIIHLNEDYVVVFNEALKKLKSLRFLQVVIANDYDFPDEVGNLSHLRYLSLQSFGYEGSILPQSVLRLYHLEVMELPVMIEIGDSILDRMSNLVKLRRLHIPNDIIMSKLFKSRLLHIPNDKMDKIPWIGKVTSLQELGDFCVREECGYKIDQLKNLQNLRKLGIRGLENVTSPEEAANANLIGKENLGKLSLRWSTDRSGGPGVDEPLLDNLRPHTNLKELEIEGYAGVRSPYWMTAISSLSNIRSIKLSNCEGWEDLPPFGQLPLLKILNLQSMQAAKKLRWSRSVGGCTFPSLEELRLIDMPNLESFEGEHMFPLLNKLEIKSCPSLKGLPALPLTLNRLKIKKAGLTSLPMMQQDCCSSGEGRASCSLSSHPALSKLSIHECPNLTSLDGFMLQQQHFPALESLSIGVCENLRHLPKKFFQKLPSLKDLSISMCPNLTLVSTGDLDLSLLEESLPILTALQSLEINSCASMTSLPLAEVCPRLLSKLEIRNCEKLSSLDGIQSCTSLASLSIVNCPSMTSLPPAEAFPSLESLRIEGCNCERWEDLPTLGQLPLLNYLRLENMRAVNKLRWSTSVGGCAFPSLQVLQFNNMPNLELFGGEHMFPLLNILQISSCPSLKGLPALPLTLNELDIKEVGLTSLPMMQQDCCSSGEGLASCASSSHPALSKLRISECPNLTSLDGFMLQQQYFPALESLFFGGLENLRHLPGKFFQKLPSLKGLSILMCPNLMEHGILDNRFPETLESPSLDLDLSLLLEESLPKLTALQSLSIGGCASMTSLPLAELYPQLSELSISDCKELSSLDGLQALPSLKYLSIEGCDKLIELSLLQPPLGLTSTSPPTGMELDILSIDRQALLRVEPLRNLNNSVCWLSISDGTELTSLDEQWLLQNRNSLQHLTIHKASSLESLPPSMIDLQSLCSLWIFDAPLLRTIPELPTSMKSLYISGCGPELKEYVHRRLWKIRQYVNVTEE